jgi:glycosyltransferase involved in cell wall biosynthesis
MRIALVVPKFPPSSVGGTEIYTLNLAQELSRRGHQVFVFYRDEQADTGREGLVWEEREGFKACRVSRGFNIKAASAPSKFLDTFYNRDIEHAFARFLNEIRPDVVHFQHVMWLSYRLIAMAKRRRLPALLTLHDYWFLCGNSQLIWPDAQVCQGKAWGLNCARCALTQVNSPVVNPLRPVIAPAFLLLDAMVRRAAWHADRWIAPSHFLIQQYVKAGFPAERFVYLENGIDVERIRRYAHQPSAGGRMRFTYLGSLAWQKGVHIVVGAFRAIPAEKALLRIYGDPTVFPDYAASLRQVADPTNTFFEGAVPNEEVGRVLAETDVVVVPSLWYENSPMVIQEAFAAEVPVVASRIGALPEKVRHGIDGLLCPVGDARAWHESVLSLAEHPEQVKQFQGHIPVPLTVQGHTALLEDIYKRM